MSAEFVAKKLHLSHGIKRASLEADDEEEIDGFPTISPRTRNNIDTALPMFSMATNDNNAGRLRAKSWTSMHPQMVS